MKNIIDILAEIGIEVPEETAGTLNKAVAENYKTISEFEKRISKLETERDALQERADAAESTLKGYEGKDEKFQSEINEWKAKAEKAENEFAAKLAERDFNDALRSELDKVKFTSGAARKSFEADVKAAGLTLSGGQIMGFSDVLEKAKANDPDAFAPDPSAQKKPTFAVPNQNPANGEVTKQTILAIKDRKERRRMIAEHQELFS